MTSPSSVEQAQEGRARKPWFRRPILVLVSAAVILAGAVAAGVVLSGQSRSVSVVPKAGTSYFVSDSACSNSWSGRSPARAWCDAGPLDGQRLKPGVRLLFACGGVWKEQQNPGERPYLSLSGRGTSARPIIVAAYDRASGAQTACTERPRLVGSTAKSLLMVVSNPDHWKIADLELSHGAVGLRVHFTSTGHRAVELDRLVVHDFEGIFRGDCTAWPHAYTALGVLFDHTLTAVPKRPTAVLRDIRVIGLEGYHNQGSLGVLGYGCAKTTATSSYLYNTVELRDLHLHDDNGPAPACSDGLQLISASDVKVVDSRFEGEGGCFTDSGTTGIILGEVSDVAFVNDVFARTPTTKSPDQSGMDLEAHTRGVSIRGSYFGEHAGAGLEILTITDSTNYQTGFLVADNLFANNSRAPLAGTGEGGHIWRTGKAPEPTGTIIDNLYSNEIPFIVGSLPGVTVSGNVGGAATSSSARDWSRAGSRWSAEFSAGDGDWQPVPRVGDEYRSADGATSVSRFVLHGSACASCSVARVWSAPTAGVVSIRGVAETVPGTAGGSVAARIEVDGSAVVSRTVVDGATVTTSADSIRVEAGQKVRFVARFRDGGELSWTPSIAYVG